MQLNLVCILNKDHRHKIENKTETVLAFHVLYAISRIISFLLAILQNLLHFRFYGGFFNFFALAFMF